MVGGLQRIRAWLQRRTLDVERSLNVGEPGRELDLAAGKRIIGEQVGRSPLFSRKALELAYPERALQYPAYRTKEEGLVVFALVDTSKGEAKHFAELYEHNKSELVDHFTEQLGAALLYHRLDLRLVYPKIVEHAVKIDNPGDGPPERHDIVFHAHFNELHRTDPSFARDSYS